MSKPKSNYEVYAEIISKISSRAAATVEGVELLGSNNDNKLLLLKGNNVHAYLIAGNNVKIDIFINIHYGYNIPDTVCKVQESIKLAIEKETCYKAVEINVSVVSIICEDEVQPEIVHSFEEEEDNN